LSATTARPPPEDRYQQQILVIETDQARSMNFLHRVKILICVLQVLIRIDILCVRADVWVSFG
jgi:hypothetical protein